MIYDVIKSVLVSIRKLALVNKQLKGIIISLKTGKSMNRSSLILFLVLLYQCLSRIHFQFFYNTFNSAFSAVNWLLQIWWISKPVTTSIQME